jgi:hypothetical protein
VTENLTGDERRVVHKLLLTGRFIATIDVDGKPFHRVHTITRHRLGPLIMWLDPQGLDDDLETPMGRCSPCKRIENGQSRRHEVAPGCARHGDERVKELIARLKAKIATTRYVRLCAICKRGIPTLDFGRHRAGLDDRG